jgi:cell division protein FtsQ
MTPADDLRTLNAETTGGWSRWRRGWRLLAVVVAGTLLVAAIGAGLTVSPVFDARAIRIEGGDHLRRADVLRLAGVGSGTNVFYLDTGDVARRLESDVWIAGATVIKDLPSTLVIDVRERVAVAVMGSKGQRELVADDGTPLGDARSGVLLPSIGPPAGAPPPSAQDVSDAARAIAALGPGTRRQVAHVSVLPDGSLLVSLSNGAVVTWGTADELGAKAAALAALLRWARKQGSHLTAADVHVPSNPTAEVTPGLAPSP